MRTLIIGAGGHGRVVEDILACLGTPALGFTDRNRFAPNVVGADDEAPQIISDLNIDSFIIGVGSVLGGPGLRDHLFSKYIAMGLTPKTAVHPSAVVASSVQLGAGTVVMGGAILNPGVVVRENAIVNTGAIIDHDCKIGAHSHVAPGCVLSGDVKIGDFCLIGTGTRARHGATVEDGVTIGAGSLLLDRYNANGTYFGNPAKAI